MPNSFNRIKQKTKAILIFLLVWFFVGNLFVLNNKVWAAIAVDTNASSNCYSGGGAQTCSSLTYSITVGAGGSNRLLVVGVVLTDNTNKDLKSVASVTYNGVNLTQIGSYVMVQSGGNAARVDHWYLIAPATGAHNVVVTLSSAQCAILSGATSLTGVDQGTPIRNHNANDGLNHGNVASVTVSSAANDLVLDTICAGTSADSTGETQQYILNVNTALECNNIGGSTKAGAASVTMNWTVNGGSNDYWVQFASSIIPTGTTHSNVITGGSFIRGSSSLK